MRYCNRQILQNIQANSEKNQLDKFRSDMVLRMEEAARDGCGGLLIEDWRIRDGYIRFMSCKEGEELLRNLADIVGVRFEVSGDPNDYQKVTYHFSWGD